MKRSRLHSFACIAVVALAAGSLPRARWSANVAMPNAQRRQLTPEQIDAQWIAANSKYDGERKRILARRRSRRRCRSLPR